MIRRPTLRARLLAGFHLFNTDGESGGSGAGDILGDDGLPAGEAPAGGGETLGDDGLPVESKGEAPKGEAPKLEEFKPDPAKSAEENAAAKKAFDDDRTLNSVPEGEYDFAAIYEEHGLTPEQVNPELLGSFNEEAKAAGMTQKQALAMARVQMKAQADYQVRIASVKKGWLDEAKADNEIGRANWTASITAGRKAIAEFGSPELSTFFKTTGIGGHPAMIKFMANVGKTLGEGKSENGGGAATTQTKSAADVFYPS